MKLKSDMTYFTNAIVLQQLKWKEFPFICYSEVVT